jgi:RNA polymerase sigma factor (sigma-70 family)
VADAEDCAQHTWLALYRRRKSIRDPQAIPAWLIRTTRRQALRMARRLGREVDLSLAPTSIDREPRSDEALARSEFRVAVEKALGELDPRCRELILYLFGSPKTPSYREIAASLGVQPNTLGPLRARCLERLKEILKKSGWELN